MEIDLQLLAESIAAHLPIAWPRWLKLGPAAKYSSIGTKRLKNLAEAGQILGYQDPESGRGDWIFDRNSIDEFREKQANPDRIRVAKILKGVR